jgi:hypothetical protein
MNPKVDKFNYCVEYWSKKMARDASSPIIESSTIFINGIAAQIFLYFGEFTKKHTKIEE